MVVMDDYDGNKAATPSYLLVENVYELNLALRVNSKCKALIVRYEPV